MEPLRCRATLHLRYTDIRCENHHHRGRFHYWDSSTARSTWYSERVLSRWWTAAGFALGAVRRATS